MNLKKLIAWIVLVVLTTSIAFSQTEVSDERLDWLFQRNNDANFYESQYNNCDSVNTDLRLIINYNDEVWMLQDSILQKKDDIILIKNGQILSKNETINSLEKKIKRNKFIFLISIIIAVSIAIIK